MRAPRRTRAALSLCLLCAGAPACIDDVVPTEGASCERLGRRCGPGGDESCCASSVVPGGSFSRTNDGQNLATVRAFRLDRFEVTVGRLRRFIDAYPGSRPVAGVGAHPLIEGSGWSPSWDQFLPADAAVLRGALRCDEATATWTDAEGENEDKPINCISWYEAAAFCAWDGGRLPTDAEWGYAAAGGDEQRTYPWGDEEPDPGRAVYDCTGNGSAPSGDCTVLGQCSPADILDVGSRSRAGDARWGHADMAGSVFEWNLDWYAAYAAACDNCANLSPPEPDTPMVVRGGSWELCAGFLGNAVRIVNGGSRGERTRNKGFRCARAP